MGQILSRAELLAKVAALRKEHKTLVTTNGCFDLLHVGHLHVLKQAKALGDVLIVAVNSDASVKRLKGPERPIVSEADRAEILANLLPVDYVTVFEEDTPVALLQAVKPNIHAKGGDYKAADLAETPIVERAGGKVVLIELRPDKSSTGLIKKLKTF